MASAVSIWTSLALAIAGIFLFLIFIALMSDMRGRIDRVPGRRRCDWCGRNAVLADLQYDHRADMWACPKCR